MQFSSFAEFISMGGYGFFVWLSFGTGLLLLTLLVWQSISGHKLMKKRIAQQIKRQSKLKQRQHKQPAVNQEVNNESAS